MNYKNFLQLAPFKYGSYTNSKGQNIDFYEHPIHGDDVPVVAVCDELEIACSTEFYELDDMIAEHKEYEPIFVNNELKYGYELE